MAKEAKEPGLHNLKRAIVFSIPAAEMHLTSCAA